MIKCWLRIILGALLGLVLLPATFVSADAPIVEITVSAWVVGYPGGFIVTYVSDYRVDITWKNPPDAVNTMVRGAVGRYPTSISDGYLVYYGPNESCSDTGVSLDETAAYVHYRAWSQSAEGVWSPLYAEGNIGGFGMVGIFLAIVALGLTMLAFWKRTILLSLGASTGWLALGIVIATAPDVTHLGTLEDNWVLVLATLCFVMTAGCLLWYIAGIGKTRITMTDSKGRTWAMWGKPPQEIVPSRSRLAKERHKERLRTLRERYRQR